MSENRLYIGQAKVKDKENEIVAIPEVLKEIAIKDAIVTIDAIGCQKDISLQNACPYGTECKNIKK